MTIAEFFNFLSKIGIAIFILTLVVGFYRVVFAVFAFIPSKKYKKAVKKGDFCILVPARNESNVIERLLDSIKAQKYDGKIDVCVIVEDINDKTVEITKSYGYECFVRTNLNNKGKGYALDEAIKELKSQGKTYDGYFIVDADNILSDNFVSIVNDAFQSGVNVANGYHAPINTPGNLVADCSVLTFSSINSFQNKARNYFTKNVVMTGTGLFISRELIEKWGGWPFHTLTEDYELSYYCTANNIETVYLPNAVFYDESPVDSKTLFNQRVRWIKGFSQVKKKYKQDIKKGMFSVKNLPARLDFTIGVLPNVLVLANYFLFTIISLVCSLLCIVFKLPGLYESMNVLLITNLALYLFLALYTIMQLVAEKEYFKPSLKQCIKILFYYPIFIMNYIPQAITAFFKKDVTWIPIKHGNVDLETSLDVIDETEKEVVESIVK